MMSSAPDVEAADERCASCGTSECDNIKLKTCTACKLVKYCSVQCQREHRSQHKKACKKKAAEIRDELLFKQPESTHLGDCPICFIPIPLDADGDGAYHVCCSKIICKGCAYVSRLHQIAEQSLTEKCPFCRTPYPKDDAEFDRMMKKRIAANDPVALGKMASDRYDEGDYGSAFEYYTKAANLGDMDAHYNLGDLYFEGEGVEVDFEKATYHLEEAAIGGHPRARVFLGVVERRRGRHERAARHFIFAAKQGFDFAVEHLKEGYKEGHVSKDDFGAALRAYQSAVDATKSPEREAAKRNPDILHSRPVIN
jgi:hypothetical protein